MIGQLLRSRGCISAPIGAVRGPIFGADWEWVRFHRDLGASLKDCGQLSSAEGTLCEVLVQGLEPFSMVVPARNGFGLKETLELLDKSGV